ncbi:hypothetical protein Tco_0750603 [Tanacetum coccineum]|uniref:CUB domain-containing protein n=1 Tax=Tanacetum coccineum TaxID=301880 RepID=A0ABQ4Z2I7_9ASTR
MGICKCAKAHSASSSLFRPGRHGFTYGPVKDTFQTSIGHLDLPTCLWRIRVERRNGYDEFNLFPREDENGTIKSMPQNVKHFTNLDGVLRHLIPLRSFSLSLARVTVFDKLVGILVNGGPKEARIKDLFGG